ncbi:NtaA/DmoA family FMN-dependent monooxygenase [Nesterenkonia lutea]|uniref:FMN-dependent oxidoreductase (Nitrilotriacetate monooxygenase family) n=1 Tax=Nesterenkonia lutea TaxID=272919 RepID=A0ABR9JHN2_9MICC|nr:NtaA/DmoA family FMN-dependent monooxygenase [Nesterenkonia lutea]MBE1525453.1 FMN-dependent oxidoreductase (nitrilotriacetate monooxygenase family) [Nesterenkonia lutea]
MTRHDRPLILSLFEMGSVVHLSPGTWTHPEDRRHGVDSLSFWRELGGILEQGRFDQLFLADVVGAYDSAEDGLRSPVSQGYQIPALDPLILLGALAESTDHLGLAATFSTTYEPPFAFARRLATLDALSEGRIAWNVVTSYLKNAAQNFGLPDQVQHDTRYEIADEFLDVVYKLLLGSWDSDAVLGDTQTRTWADPDKVRYIDHKGRHFSVRGPHLVAPSPQRLPVIFQAGSSLTGMAFAGRHAEVVFLGGNSPEAIRANVETIKSHAAASGRDPDQLRFLAAAQVIVAPTEEQAHAKAAEIDRCRSDWAALQKNGRIPGLERYPHEELVADIIRRRDPGHEILIRGWREGQRVKDLRGSAGAGGRARNGLRVVGTGAQAADALTHWAHESGLDGFNIGNQISFGTIRDFVELVVPVLQRRGLARTEYTPGQTLRERLLGAGPGPHSTHPSSRYLDPSNLKLPAAPFGARLTPA